MHTDIKPNQQPFPPLPILAAPKRQAAKGMKQIARALSLLRFFCGKEMKAPYSFLVGIFN